MIEFIEVFLPAVYSPWAIPICRAQTLDYHSLGFLVQSHRNLKIIVAYEIIVMNYTYTVIPFLFPISI